MHLFIFGLGFLGAWILLVAKSLKSALLLGIRIDPVTS